VRRATTLHYRLGKMMNGSIDQPRPDYAAAGVDLRFSAIDGGGADSRHISVIPPGHGYEYPSQSGLAGRKYGFGPCLIRLSHCGAPLGVKGANVPGLAPARFYSWVRCTG